MGKDARIKSERIHVRKFLGGMRTPLEEWRLRVLRGAKCQHCRTAPAVGQLLMFCPADEFIKQKRFERLRVQYATEGSGMIPTVKFKIYKEKEHWQLREFVAMPVVYYCAGCKKDVSHFAAKAPSYIVSEFRDGPDNHSKISVQAPGLSGLVAS